MEDRPKTIAVAEHRAYALLWDLAEQMAGQDGKTAESCWGAIINAFWDGELPALFVFVRRRLGRELMRLPPRDVLAGHLLGRVAHVNHESASTLLYEWIAELRGWALQDYQQQPEPFCGFVARDTHVGLAIPSADFDQWRGKRLHKPQGRTLSEQSMVRTRKRRYGPQPGTLRRYEKSDRKLFAKLKKIMSTQHKSATAAAYVLAESGEVEGIGTNRSRAMRLAALYLANEK
jgi:hypothetical protein